MAPRKKRLVPPTAHELNRKFIDYAKAFQKKKDPPPSKEEVFEDHRASDVTDELLEEAWKIALEHPDALFLFDIDNEEENDEDEEDLDDEDDDDEDDDASEKMPKANGGTGKAGYYAFHEFSAEELAALRLDREAGDEKIDELEAELNELVAEAKLKRKAIEVLEKKGREISKKVRAKGEMRDAQLALPMEQVPAVTPATTEIREPRTP